MVTTRARHSANKVMAHHDGDEQNAGNRDGGIKENDGIHNDGNEGSVGNDVDEVNDGYKSLLRRKNVVIKHLQIQTQHSLFPHPSWLSRWKSYELN